LSASLSAGQLRASASLSVGDFVQSETLRSGRTGRRVSSARTGAARASPEAF